jgi:hypothetical protein
VKLLFRIAAFIFVVGIFMSQTSSGGGFPSSQPGSGIMQGADLILLHGKIWTGEPASRPGVKPAPAKFAEAVAIANGHILAVGSDAEIQGYAGASTRVVDLKGRLTSLAAASSFSPLI